jgi:hypothetical protein
MTANHKTTPPLVGPVLEASEIGRAVVAAILTCNAEATVDDRGAYLRVSVPGCCTVTRRDIESQLGRHFVLPRDLELVMPAFRGLLRMSDEGVEWRLETE